MGTTLRHTEWSTSGLIASISRNAMLPAQQATFETADFLEMMNEACESIVVPFIVGLDASYFNKAALTAIVQSNSTALSAGFAGSQGDNVAYQLPADAVGKKLVDVSIMQSDGSPVAIPQVTDLMAGSPSQFQWGCEVMGDVLYLYPASIFNGASYLRLVYPAAPLALCEDTGATGDASTPSAAAITAVDTSTKAVTLSTVPASFTVGASINFVRGTPQFATTVTANITSIVGSVVTTDAASFSDAYGQQLVNAGDWAANAGYSPFLQLPKEARNLVTQATLVKCFEAMGVDSARDKALATYLQMEKAAIKIFSPRINDSPKVLTTAGRGVGAWRRWSRYTRR